MQFNDHQAYLEGDSLIVLRPGQSPLKGIYKDNIFTPLTNEGLDLLADTALAHTLWANIMYKDRAYN